MVKNTIPAYENPGERDILLKKQYQQLQKRFHEEGKKMGTEIGKREGRVK